ncbi:MAG: thiamine diphosphokinase [Lachnospira sp.]
MNRVLIVTGGNVDIRWAKSWLNDNSFDYCIAADKGLYYAHELGIKVDYVLGDFDSLPENVLDGYKSESVIETFPTQKDYTDTHLAIITAIKLGAEAIYIIGATGNRLDHTMTSIGNLKAAYDSGVECYIVDSCNKIYMAGEDSGTITVKKDKQYGKFISFYPFSENVVFSVTGVKYPIDEFSLSQGLSICQSNEIINEDCLINVKYGIMIIFESTD